MQFVKLMSLFVLHEFSHIQLKLLMDEKRLEFGGYDE